MREYISVGKPGTLKNIAFSFWVELEEHQNKVLEVKQRIKPL
jgi:hypothetical protein